MKLIKFNNPTPPEVVRPPVVVEERSVDRDKIKVK